MGAKTTRLLAAVMFTDIVGYTAMMQEDEENANEQKERQRQVLREGAKEFDGKVLHYYGDGALTIFSSAYNAVRCGIKIQEELVDPFLPMRIGIHIGDVVYDNEDVYGDAVNIASRLEEMAVSGGILISQKVLDEIKNHRNIQTKELGVFDIKNVKQPISIFAIANEGINVPSAREIKAKSGRRKDRIAVLPFVNMSDEKGFDYFGDGLTEELINGLTKMEQLDVTSRTSVFSYKGRNEDVRTIGEKLMVSHVLEGSVRKNKDKIRVTAQLIETSGGFHLWSETYERHLKDIFEIQDGLTGEILQKIRRSFEDTTPEEDQFSTPTSNTDEGYESYLEGNFELQKYTVSSIRKAMSLFNTAVDINPNDIRPQLGLAKCFLFLGILGQMSPQRAYRKTEEHVHQVLDLEPDNDIGQAIKGISIALQTHDYDEANDWFARAIEEKADAETCYFYFLFLNMLGKKHLSLLWMEQALVLEPTNTLYNAELARAYYINNRYAEALEQYNYTLGLDSVFLPAIEGKGWTFVAMNQLKKAHKAFENYQKLVSQEQRNIPHLGYISARLGMHEMAKHFLEELQLGDVSDSYIASPVDIALIFLGMKKIDEVFFYLKRAADDRIGKFYFILADPVWDEIKDDPRYDELLSQLNIHDVQDISLTTPVG
ncbi:adenylate/guanylate cyclase domain-containing protein [Fodinibius sp. Rm-B-1B1-1]|uniref:adenylate/guanylate cyclase domain-containing protein n=1 Tax=Fodinibius alkaliphilus TaxID=3140241 RepID=UPI00315A471D